jgi:GrpB-like predicted nucleotidyltransferase (UPF0157 family)
MSSDTRQSGEASVQIVPYDPAWPSLFERERALLESRLGPWLAGPVEHVGSTAVPGLVAKPVIDIMAAVASLAASADVIAAAATAGYQYFPYRPDVMHWFCKPSPAHRTHHLHLVPFNSRLWIERVAFRDCLRRDASVAAEYAALKSELARRHEFDREAYTDAKGPFIRGIVERLLPLGSQR